MSWMPWHTSESHADRTKEAVFANVHRGLLLASASRRLQDSISARRAAAQAQQLLAQARKLCEEVPDLTAQDERVRFALASLTRALEP
jgi:hypothetical protein